MADFYLITAPNRPDLYWRPESRGYTVQIAEAGVYTKKEAKQIVALRRGDQMVSLCSLANTIEQLIKKCDEDKLALMEMRKNING